MSEQSPKTKGEQFSSESAEGRSGLVREFIDFLKHNKKWWLAPIIVLFVIFGLLVLFSGTAAGPFVYTLF